MMYTKLQMKSIKNDITRKDLSRFLTLLTYIRC